MDSEQVPNIESEQELLLLLWSMHVASLEHQSQATYFDPTQTEQLVKSAHVALIDSPARENDIGASLKL